MRLPTGYASRPATWDDLDDVVVLLKACDVADVGFEDPVREHLEEDWRRPGFDFERHSALVLAGAGPPVAYAEVFGPNPERSVEAFARVHPAHRGRGVGSGIIDWAEERARQHVPARAPSALRVHVPESDEGARRLLATRGHEPVRIFWHMERELAGAIEPATLPEGIEIRTYRHEEDADAVHDAIDEAFADHWGYEPLPGDTYMEEMRRYDPALVEVALEGDEVVGVLMARTVEPGGWVDVLGVRRPWRGRGIARALLLRSFASLEERGAAAVKLNVDSENATGATRLYESVGMRVRRAWLAFEKQVPGNVS